MFNRCECLFHVPNVTEVSKKKHVGLYTYTHVQYVHVYTRVHKHTHTSKYAYSQMYISDMYVSFPKTMYINIRIQIVCFYYVPHNAT